MTIRDTNSPGNDNTTDPEVRFDPNASATPVASAPPADNLPIASATAIPIVSATAVPEETPSLLSSDGSNIERITHADGSLTVKVTNTTSNSDGSRTVRVEEYEVPANMANSVIQSMDMTGDAPSSLYLTKIEDHRLPPPQGQSVGVVGATSSTAGGVMPSAGTAYPTTSGGGGTTVDEEEIQNRIKGCALTVIVAFMIVLIGINVFSHSSSSGYTPSYNDDYWSTPTYPTNDDNWYTPTYPTNDDYLNNPTWSFSFPPAIFMPQTPTKSPSPTITPYPTWAPTKSPSPTISPYPTWAPYRWSYPFQWPGYSPLFSPTSSPDAGNPPTLPPGTQTSNQASTVKTFMRNGNANKKDDPIQLPPDIISPTFTKDPTAAPTPGAISTVIQDTLVEEENKIAESARI